MSSSQELPQDWSRVDLVKLAQVIDPHPSHRAPDEERDGVPFAGIGDLNEKGEIVTDSVRRVSPRVLNEHASRYTLSGNSIGFGRVASIGKVIDFQESVSGIAISPTMAVIEPKSVDRKYITQALRSNFVREQIDRLLTGTTRSSLGIEHLRKLSIPMPANGESEKIGLILTAVDNAVNQTEALIAKYQRIKAGLMHDLFTRGVTSDGRLRPTRTQAPHLYKESPLGWIPKEWEVDRIAEVFEVQLGKMLNKLAKTGKLSAPYLGNRAVQWDFVDCTAVEVMDFTASERLKFMLMPGDLLVCEGGDVGRTALWRGEIEDCYYQKAIHRLRPKSDRALSTFMLRFMRFARDSGYFREFTSQSSIAHLTQEKLGSISMVLPASSEQRRIADRFDTIDGLIQTEQSKLAKLFQQKHGLMQDLLTGRVRVKVAEPASR